MLSIWCNKSKNTFHTSSNYFFKYYKSVYRLIRRLKPHPKYTLFYIRTNYYWPRLSCSYFWTQFWPVFNLDPPWIICIRRNLSGIFFFYSRRHKIKTSLRELSFTMWGGDGGNFPKKWLHIMTPPSIFMTPPFPNFWRLFLLE